MLLPHWLGGNACDLHSAEGESSSSSSKQQFLLDLMSSRLYNTARLVQAPLRHSARRSYASEAAKELQFPEESEQPAH